MKFSYFAFCVSLAAATSPHRIPDFPTDEQIDAVENAFAMLTQPLIANFFNEFLEKTLVGIKDDTIMPQNAQGPK
jgi:hypothetical protein